MANDIFGRVYCGNASVVLQGFPDKVVQCVITSPPYYGLRDYGHADQLGLEETPDEYVAKLVAIFREVRRVLKDDGVLWLNLGDSYAAGKIGRDDNDTSTAGINRHNGKLSREGNNGRQRLPSAGLKPKDLIGIPWMVAFALRADGWYLRQEIIWSKPNPMPESVKDRCVKSHEQIFLLSKSQRYYFDYKAIQEPAKADWGTRDRKGGKYHNAGTGLSPHSGLEKSYEMANKRSVWEVATRGYKGAHFAIYPVELIMPCVLAGSRPGDVILDPFTGSGTTWEAALRADREFVGIELNPEYIELANERTMRFREKLF